MGASVQKEKDHQKKFENLQFMSPNEGQYVIFKNGPVRSKQFQQPSKSCSKAQTYMRQDSGASFVETTKERNKKGVINGYDTVNSKNLQESQKKKDAGNKYYEMKQYEKAIDSYTGAIVYYDHIKLIKLYDRESLYYSNRAVALKAMGKVEQAVKDCETAISLCDTNVRAISLYGAAMIMKSKYIKRHELDEGALQLTIKGIKYMDDAHHLMVTQEGKSKDKLKQSNKSNLLKARRVLFLQARELDEKNAESLVGLIQMLMNRSSKDHKVSMKDLRSFVEINILQDVMVPDYYICVITQELMQEPLMTETGHSYDKDALVTQFKTNGCIDPNTRQSINPQRIVYNMSLKMGILEIKNRCGWLGGDQSDEKDYSRINLE